jgi:hypothetical protein
MIGVDELLCDIRLDTDSVYDMKDQTFQEQCCLACVVKLIDIHQRWEVCRKLWLVPVQNEYHSPVQVAFPGDVSNLSIECPEWE